MIVEKCRNDTNSTDESITKFTDIYVHSSHDIEIVLLPTVQ